MFPLENLRHSTIHLHTGPVNKYDGFYFGDLLDAIHSLHLSLPGLQLLNIETIWTRHEQRYGNLALDIQPLDPKYLYCVHKEIYMLAMLLCAATEHIPNVALESGELVRIQGVWDQDEVGVQTVFLLLFTQGVKSLLTPEVVQCGT